MTIKIEHGMPIPADGRRRPIYPFDAMTVGDSFFVPNKKPTDISGAVHYAQRKHPGWRFARRAVDGGVRVWRVA